MKGLDQITVVIAANPIQSHPSTHMISAVIDSLSYLGITHEVPLVLAHDAPPPNSTSDVVSRFEEYLSEIEVLGRIRGNTQISLLRKWGQLTSSLREAMCLVETKYVLVCQHDLVFTRPVEMEAALWVLDHDSSVKHIRFNLQRNKPYSFDARPQSRLRSYREKTYVYQGRPLSVISTLAWSDNNHLTSRDYYDRLVFPMVGKRKVPPEHVMNLASTSMTHKYTGTYIWSGLGDEPYLHHLDGKEGRTYSYKLRQPIELDNLQGRVRFWWIRVTVNANRLRYIVKIFVLSEWMRIQRKWLEI